MSEKYFGKIYPQENNVSEDHLLKGLKSQKKQLRKLLTSQERYTIMKTLTRISDVLFLKKQTALRESGFGKKGQPRRNS